MGVDKKALKKEYKEAVPRAGVYRVRNTADDRSLVGSSANVRAMLNRHRAALRMNAHADKALQRDWNERGEAAFEFEVLDEIEPPADRPNYDPKDDLKALESLWLDRLSPYGERGYNAPPK